MTFAAGFNALARAFGRLTAAPMPADPMSDPFTEALMHDLTGPGAPRRDPDDKLREARRAGLSAAIDGLARTMEPDELAAFYAAGYLIREDREMAGIEPRGHREVEALHRLPGRAAREAAVAIARAMVFHAGPAAGGHGRDHTGPHVEAMLTTRAERFLALMSAEDRTAWVQIVGALNHTLREEMAR